MLVDPTECGYGDLSGIHCGIPNISHRGAQPYLSGTKKTGLHTVFKPLDSELSMVQRDLLNQEPHYS